MERIKSFHIKAEPTAKGTGREHLADLIDATVNGWLEKTPDAKNCRVSHSAESKTSFPEALVIITYEIDGRKAAKSSANES